MKNNGQTQNLREIIENEGIYVGLTFGTSMRPMIKSGRDVVAIEKKKERLKPLDVAFYVSGDRYVLHRVIEVLDGGYLIRGDNCYIDERVKEEDVVGVLTSFFKGEKEVSLRDEKYLAYVRRRMKNYKARRAFFVAKKKMKNFVKKLIGRGK